MAVDHTGLRLHCSHVQYQLSLAQHFDGYLAQDYKDTTSLRYGHIMIMTDQDHDGSHIKGLLMNFMHHFYPSLLKVPGFLIEFITPIVKVNNVPASHTLF